MGLPTSHDSSNIAVLLGLRAKRGSVKRTVALYHELIY